MRAARAAAWTDEAPTETDVKVAIEAARAAREVAIHEVQVIARHNPSSPALAKTYDALDVDWTDVDRLLALGLGEPGTLGSPIDPSESGPLGPLWPGGEPAWLRKAGPGTPEPPEFLELEDVAELVVEVDVPEDASDEDVLAMVGELVLHADDLHRSMGGHGLKVEGLEVHQDAGVPAEAPRD